MPDPLSAGSAAVGVLSLAIQTCSGIVQYYEAWRDFEHDIQSLRTSIEQLTRDLQLLRDSICSESLSSRRIAPHVESCVQGCESKIQKLSRRLGKLSTTRPEPLRSGQGAATGRVRERSLRLLYPFRQGTVGKLRDEISDLRDGLEPALALLGIEIAEETAGDVRTIRDEQRQWRREEENARILAWLSPLDFDGRHRELVSKQRVITISEMTSSVEFIAWNKDESTAPRGLWYCAPMGSGKSVAAAAMVEHLKKLNFGDSRVVVLFAYCDWQDSQAQTTNALLGSLLKQCAQACENLPDSVRALYSEHRSGRLLASNSDILGLLQALASDFDRVYILLDGLDELGYEQASESPSRCMVSMEEALHTILRMSGPRNGTDIRVLVTCRFTPRSDSPSAWAILPVSITPEHVRTFVTYALHENEWMSPWASSSLATRVRANADLIDEIVEICTASANNTFLLPHLSVSYIKQQLNMRELRRALLNLPEAFEDAINACILRLLNQRQALRDLGIRTLLWISHACRPLTVQEMQEALAVEPADDELKMDGIYDVRLILTSCMGLVNVAEESNTFRFINLGVQDCLQKNGSIFTSDPHYVILKTCMTVFKFKQFAEYRSAKRPSYTDALTESDKDSDIVKELRSKHERCPLFRYASEHWHTHQKLATDPQAIEMTVELLADEKEANFLYTIFYATQFESSATLATGVTGLHVFCLFGLKGTDRLLAILQEQGAKDQASRPDSFDRAPLWFAAACGNLHALNLLLDNGQRARGRPYWDYDGRSCSKWWYPAWARDECFSDAVEVAAEHGYTDIVQRLIKAGVSFDGFAGIHGGALEAAVFKGHEDLVSILLAAGAPIQSSTIQAAVYGNQTDILSRLLDSFSKQEAPLKPRYAYGDFFIAQDINHTMMSQHQKISLALYAAAISNRLAVARMLLERGADVNAETSGFHCTALAAASAYGRLDMAKLLLEHSARVNQAIPLDALPDYRRRNYYTLSKHKKRSGRHGSALQAAAFAGYVDVVRLLCKNGADVNAPGGYFGPAIQAATISGEVEIVRFLIESGADLNAVGGCYGTCLQAAAFYNQCEIMELLVRAGADVNQEGGEFGYPLVAAAVSHNVEALDILATAGAWMNVVATDLGSALTAVVATGDRLSALWDTTPWKPRLDGELDDFVELTENPRSMLPSQSTTLRISVPLFGTYIEAAAREYFIGCETHPSSAGSNSARKDEKISKMTVCIEGLLSHGADPNTVGGEYGTPLLAAISMSNLHVTKTLLAAGASISAKQPSDETSSTLLGPLSSRYGYLKRTKTCLNSAVVPDYQHGRKCSDDQVDICRIILDQGSDPNEKSLPGDLSLLHVCAVPEITKMLLERGAVVDTRSKKGYTPLDHAIIRENTREVELLVHAGADVNSPSASGTTPLIRAAREGLSEVAEILLKAGADIHVRTKEGATPLHGAAKATSEVFKSDGAQKTVTLLLKAGVDPNVLDDKGQTALDLANHKQLSLIMQLLEAGADPKTQQVAFLNAVSRELSYDAGHLEVAQWLIDRGYDVNSSSEKWTRYSFRKASRNALLSLASYGPDNPERLAFLLRNGIDLETYGEEALQLAVRNKNHIIARGLREAGVKEPEPELESSSPKQDKVKSSKSAAGRTKDLPKRKKWPWRQTV